MKRIAYIDQISGLLIVYMIAFHAFQFCDMRDIAHSYLMQSLSFFMFWFFYKSGMFYRDRTCKEILYGGGKKLLIPFVVFSVIGHLFTCVHLWAFGDYNWIHFIFSPIKSILLSGAVGGNLALWFLPSLLCVQLAYSALHQKMRDGWIVVIAFAMAFITHNLSSPVPLYVGNVPLGLLAYTVGHLMRDIQFRKDTFLLSLIVYVVIFVIQPENIDFRGNHFNKGIYPIAIIFGLSGCVFINNLFKRLSVSLRLLEYIGVRSMPFYVMHWIVVSVCSWTLPLTGWSMFAAIAVSCLIILPIVEKAVSYLRMEWVFGVKNKR